MRYAIFMLFYGLAICLLLLLGFAAFNDKAAMEKCEQHKSHEECFYALNR